MAPHRHKERAGRVLLLSALLAYVILTSISVTSFSQGPNNRNVSVDTRVNVTGAAPEILTVSVPNPVTLYAGSITQIVCNASIRDFNGFGDLSIVNATLFSNTVAVGNPDDNNTHYTNTTCSVISGQQSGAYANYTCMFPVTYYAVNGTWNCSIRANDSINLQGTGSNLLNISALLALNVTTLIDYGNMAMGDTSGNQEANVTNLGNVNINVSVQGYGRAINDGWSMVCEQGNLTVNLQHFAANTSAAYAEKQALGSSLAQVYGLTINKTTNANPSLNSTYWQLYLDTAQNVFGLCNGTIVFQAEASR